MTYCKSLINLPLMSKASCFCCKNESKCFLCALGAFQMSAIPCFWLFNKRTLLGYILQQLLVFFLLSLLLHNGVKTCQFRWAKHLRSFTRLIIWPGISMANILYPVSTTINKLRYVYLRIKLKKSTGAFFDQRVGSTISSLSAYWKIRQTNLARA